LPCCNVNDFIPVLNLNGNIWIFSRSFTSSTNGNEVHIIFVAEKKERRVKSKRAKG
jgi:hypothetical protein